VDLEKFFDRVNHDVLMGRLAKRIEDRRLLGLIRRYLSAGVLEGDVPLHVEIGWRFLVSYATFFFNARAASRLASCARSAATSLGIPA
jgi:hypothetical protein